MNSSSEVLEYRWVERTQLLLAAVVLFLIASGICSFFIYATIEKLYARTLLDQYAFIGDKLLSEMRAESCAQYMNDPLAPCVDEREWRDDEVVERLLDRYAHIMTNRVGVTTDAGSASSTTKQRVTVSRLSLAGKVLGSSDKTLRGQQYPAASDDDDLAGGATFAHTESGYDVRLSMADRTGHAAGELAFRVPTETINWTLQSALEQHRTAIYFVILAGAGLLTLGFGICVPSRISASRLPTKRTTTLILATVCVAQLGSFVAATRLFDGNYPHFSHERTELFAETVQSNLERQVERGVSLEEFAAAVEAGQLKGETSGSIPNPLDGSFAILDREGETVLGASFSAGTLSTVEASDSEPALSGIESTADMGPVLLDLRVRDGKVGYLLANTAEGEIASKIRSLGVEAVIAITIALLCLFELLLLVFKFIEKRALSRVSEPRPIHYGVIRPVIFLFLFGIDLSAALIPLQMERLYEPILGLPKDVVLGLPVSAMFLMVGVTFLIAGAWMDRRGWHEPFIVGVLITGVSKFCAWLAPDAFMFVLAMAGIGFGYGLALMAAQGFVMANTTDKEKAHGISFFFAGVYAGSIGGTAIGAMLAERLGYDLVFLLGSMFIFACFGCGVFFLRSTFRRPEAKQVVVGSDAQLKRRFNFVSFLLDRNVLTLVVFCSIPSAVAVIGFLNYFSPVYLSRLGVSESIIGGVLTLYGISMVYISPFIGRWIDATERKDIFIVMGCGLGGCAFMSFHFLTGLPATIVAIIFLGLSMACLQASQTTYTLKLRATHRFGDGKAVAMVRATSRIGQMLGPMVFSGLVIADDTERAMTYFGLVYFVFAILFFALSKRETKDEEPRLFGEAVPATGENKG